VYEIFRYIDPDGVEVVTHWLRRLRDKRAHAKITARFVRVAIGNFGDHRMLGGGIGELRIDHGPGYRVYFGLVDREIVLLLCGGDKSTQSRDIETAKLYLRQYQQRRAHGET